MQRPSGYVSIPYWAIGLGAASALMVLLLAAVTIPLPWNCPAFVTPLRASITPTLSACPVTPNAAGPLPTLAPRLLTGVSRTLGDPQARIALVEFADFQ